MQTGPEYGESPVSRSSMTGISGAYSVISSNRRTIRCGLATLSEPPFTFACLESRKHSDALRVEILQPCMSSTSVVAVLTMSRIAASRLSRLPRRFHHERDTTSISPCPVPLRSRATPEPGPPPCPTHPRGARPLRRHRLAARGRPDCLRYRVGSSPAGCTRRRRKSLAHRSITSILPVSPALELSGAELHRVVHSNTKYTSGSNTSAPDADARGRRLREARGQSSERSLPFAEANQSHRLHSVSASSTATFVSVPSSVHVSSNRSEASTMPTSSLRSATAPRFGRAPPSSTTPSPFASGAMLHGVPRSPDVLLLTNGGPTASVVLRLKSATSPDVAHPVALL